MKKFVVVLCVFLLTVGMLVVVGCGGGEESEENTPEQVVQKFTESIENKNMDSYLSCILPDQVGGITQEQKDAMKQELEAEGQSFESLTMKAEINPDDKDQAKVILTGGKITIEASGSAPGQAQTIAVTELPEEQRTIYCRKYKGRWYLDMLEGVSEEPAPGQVPPPEEGQPIEPQQTVPTQ